MRHSSTKTHARTDRRRSRRSTLSPPSSAPSQHNRHLDAVCRTASTLFAAPFASVSILDDTCQWYAGRVGFAVDSIPRDLAFCSWTVRTEAGAPLVIPDARCDARFADNPLVTGAPHLRFYAGVPLCGEGGCYSATLCIADVVPRPNFSPEEIRRLQDVAVLVEGLLRLRVAHDRSAAEAEILRATLDSMDQGLLMTDAEDRVRIHNRRIIGMLGLPEKLLLDGKPFGAIRRYQKARGEFTRVPERLRRWLEHGDPETHVRDYERERPDGSVLQVCSSPLPSGGVVRTFTDVTARRRAERSLRESERRYRLIAENASDIIVRSDLDAVRKYVSPAVTAILGYAPEELIGTSPFDIVHPDDATGYARIIDDVCSGRIGRKRTEQRYRHRDGSWIWLDVAIAATNDPETGRPDGFVATKRDITARKGADEALRDSEARYRALADALPQIVLISSPETGEACYANRRFAEYHGPVGPSRQARLELVHPDDAGRVQRIWNEAKGRDGRYEIEVRLRRHDGVYRWHRITAAPVARESAITGMLSTALDIDDIVTAREELERTTELLRLAQDAANAGMWEWDAGADRLILSPASARMHGLTGPADAEEPITLTMAEWRSRIVTEDLATPEMISARSDLGAGKTAVAEFRIPTSERPGGHLWVQSFGRAVRGGQRESLFVGLHLDVTARRQAEEALRASEARLRISEERLSLALDSGDDGLLDVDFEKDALWVSRRWVEHLGYDASIARPKEFWVAAIHPDDSERHIASLQAHYAGVRPVIEDEHRLRRADGTYVWVLLRARVTDRASDGRPLRLVGTLIDITRRKEAEMRIIYMAEHDALTGLANRYLFRQRLDVILKEAGNGQCRHAVLTGDLDRFKAVNDSFGHLAGDRLLCAVAERIRGAVRPQDLVARLGGDEFAVILDGIAEDAAVSDACTSVIAALSDPIHLNGVPVQVGISVGAAVIADDGADVEEVFKRADIALFQAKAAGRNTYRLFEPGAHARIAMRSLLALDMREAIQRGDFFLVFQPVIDVLTGAVASFEALMRWRHPKLGLVSPGEFIPVAEETGLIVQLGAWALVEACREAADWPEAIRIAVNISTVQFRGGLEAAVATALGSADLPASRLVLEVTESALMHDPEQAVATLRRLRALGTLVALDDFGTGYSSLSYLRLFPFDKLKIDRSFIRDIADPDAAAIVRAVVGIGERLNMGVVAEGVETAEQLELVRREGCEQVQGFLFSRPMAGEDAREFIAANKNGS